MRHLWSGAWQSTYCGDTTGARTTTTLLVTCPDCYRNLSDMVRLLTDDDLTVEQMFEEAEEA